MRTETKQVTNERPGSGTVSESRTSRRPGSIVALSVLVALLAIGAAQGGIAMLANPIDPLGMSPSFLDGTPVSDYFWPGMFLVCIALASVVTSVGLFWDWRWPWAQPIEEAAGFRWPWLGAVAIGSILLIFEIIELFIVPFHPVMHPLLVAWSVAIVTLAYWPTALSFLSLRRKD